MASPYEVAIHLTVTGNAQAGLAAAGQQINKLNEGVNKLHKAFALLFVGGEMKRFGEAALGNVKKMLDAAGNFQQVQAQMSAMGMTQTEIAESVSGAWKSAARNIHIGVQELAQMNRHAIEIFGGAKEAAEHMPLMAKLAEFQAKWGAGKTGLKQVDVPMAIRDMMKTAEGAAMLQSDPKKFDDFAEKLMRSIISAGGNVSSTQYLQAQRLARGAQFGWSDEYRFGAFPALVQEYGHAAGTSAYQSFKKLGAGVSWDKTGIVQGIEMGLIDPNKVEYDKVGRPMRLMPGALYYAKEFGADPLKFTEQHITPWLNKNVGPDPAERTAAIVRLLGRATGTTTIQAYDMQSYKLHKDIRQFKAARLDMPDTYDQAIVAFEEKLKDLMTALGMSSLKDATNALGAITKAIVNLTVVINAHPEAAKDLLAIAAGFGVMMTALGALAIGAGIAGLLGGGVIIVGLTALTGGLAGLAAANWPTITSRFKEFLDSLRNTDWNKEITKALTPAIAAIKAWFTNLGDAIMDALKGIWADMKKGLGSLFHINYTGDGFGGGGLTNAAWSGGGASASAISRMASAGSISPEVASYIRASAIRNGIDPNVALAVAGNEGARGYYTSGIDRGGDHGTSFGPYQLHYSGRGAEGDLFTRATGLNARNRATWKAQVDWALGRAAKHGWGAWMGARDHGIAPWQGIHKGKSGGETHVHNHIYLDGKTIAKSTSKHLVRAAQYPTSVGRQDGRGTFMGPGAEVFA